MLPTPDAFASHLHPRLSPVALRWGARLLSLFGFALAWEWTARRLDSLLLPAPGETLQALGNLLVTPNFWHALWLSNQAMLLGFALAMAVGIPAGLAMGRWRWVERTLDPYLSLLLVVPMAALIPVVIMAVGIGLPARVIVVFTFAIAVVTVSVRAGMRLVDTEWVEMARSFGATEGQLWRKLLLRAALPGMLTGLRLGLARAMTGMVTVELLLVALGIGRVLLEFQGNFQADGLYATVVVVVIEAALLQQLASWLMRRLFPWLTHESVP